MTRPLLLILALTLVSLSAFTQIRQAEKEMTLYNFAEAVTLLQKALKKGDPVQERAIAPLLAECYRKMNDWFRSRMWYQRAIDLGENRADNYFYLAQAYRNTGNYLEAKRFFRICDSLDPKNPVAGILATCCDSAICWMANEPAYEVGNMHSLNSPQSEFGCIHIPAGILFTSDRITEPDQEKRYGWTGNDYLRLYLAKPSPSATGKTGDTPDAIDFAFFLAPEIFHGLGDQTWHDGPVSFDGSFREAFINRTLGYGDIAKRDPDHTRTHLLKIFTSVRGEKEWNKPESFFLNNRSYSVGHPAISPDGNHLFFVSDRPDGFGGTDIYRCDRLDGVWGTPVNLGPVVNTPGNEMFPFIRETDELWFSSDYHPGFGGLDIFIACQVNGIWTVPRNPGHPLNSSYDDFSAWTDSSGKEGLFSSNRPGGMGGDDIYWFREAQGHRGTGAQDSSEQLVVGSNVIASVAKQGQEADSSFTTAPLHPGTTEKVMVSGYKLNQSYQLENIYYDFDKWVIREDAKPALDSLVRILERYPVDVELGSHTDCRGTDEYNLELSRKRAESAVQYIISRGIDPRRITAKGYGETMLINRCSCQEEGSCTEAGHQENRRTEFILRQPILPGSRPR